MRLPTGGKPGRPPRQEPWSELGLKLPARLHDAIIKAAELDGESVQEWIREASRDRLRRDGRDVPIVGDDDDGGPLIVG